MTSTTIRIKQKSAEGKSPHPRSETGCSGQGLDGHHLAALVVATGGTDPMRNIRSRALRAGAQLRQFEHAIVCPAHALAASGGFSLGYTHKFAFYNFNLFNAAQADDKSSLALAPVDSRAGACGPESRPRHSGSHNGCCGNARTISSRT